MANPSLQTLGIQASWQQLKALDLRSRLEPPCVIQSALAPRNLINIGAFTGIYGGRLGHATIGRYCSISYNVDIASSQHPADWLSTSMIQYSPDVHGWESWLKTHHNIQIPDKPRLRFASYQPVQIDNDVWIGQGAFIKSGVHIGDGAIIAAHAVVTKDVNPYEIVAGVPARAIRQRFPDKICEKLLQLQWWKYCISALQDIDFSHVESAIETIDAAIATGSLKPYLPSPVCIGDLH